MNIAASGTYKLHKTEASHGTPPRRVRPICGQSTSRSYLSVLSPETAEQAMTHPAYTKCMKCFS